MNYNLDGLDRCEWVWDDDQTLLRKARPDLDIYYEGPMVDLYNDPRVMQGGGRVSYAFCLQQDGPPVLVETRDHTELVSLPIWANARIVPTTDPFYGVVRNLLEMVDA